MLPPPPFSRWLYLTAVFLGVLAILPPAHAQKQEEGILAKVRGSKPANSEAFEFAGAGKTFGTAAMVGSKQATVKSFAFSSKSSLYGGDGKFRSKAFNNPRDDGFRTAAYGVKASQVSQRNSFAQGDKLFATDSASGIREAPAAGRSANTRAFVLPNRPYEWHGKRQDTLDAVYKNNPTLNIDQIRDLLNRGPAGRP